MVFVLFHTGLNCARHVEKKNPELSFLSPKFQNGGFFIFSQELPLDGNQFFMENKMYFEHKVHLKGDAATDLNVRVGAYSAENLWTLKRGQRSQQNTRYILWNAARPHRRITAMTDRSVQALDDNELEVGDFWELTKAEDFLGEEWDSWKLTMSAGFMYVGPDPDDHTVSK